MSKKARVQRELTAILFEVVGSVLIAIGVYNFAMSAGFPISGFQGVAIIFNRLLGLPVGLTTIVLNIPIALWCYKLLGRQFFLRSLRCMVISSLFIDYVAPLFPVYTGDRLLAALCMGVVAGLGYAIIYMQNSSTGGSDFIIMAVKAKKPHLTLGKIIFLADAAIVVAGGILFEDIDGIIYGMIVNFLFAVVTDKVMYGVNSGKLALIVTSHGKRIADVIEQTCGRGSTILKAAGGYREEERQVVMCACNNKQMYLVQRAVKETDPAAFTVILESNEVHGEGFRTVQIGEKKE